MADEFVISVYHPWKGYAMVCYGPKGPEYTGMGHDTWEGAIEEAKQEAIDTGYELRIPEHLPTPEEEAAHMEELRQRINEIKSRRNNVEKA